MNFFRKKNKEDELNYIPTKARSMIQIWRLGPKVRA